jgi:hypothetical protein
MPIDPNELRIVKRIDVATPIVIDDLAVDPNSPNTEVDGRDFLIWQRGNTTPGPDDNVGLPAVQTDNGLLLPAVKTDDGLLLPPVTDGTSNTFMFGEVVKPSLPADDEVLVAFEFGDVKSGDTFDFKELTSEPTTAADGSIPTETLSLNFDKWPIGPIPETEGFTSEQPAPEAIKGGWYIPLLVDPGPIPEPTGGDVATEKITLVHEGFDLM